MSKLLGPNGQPVAAPVRAAAYAALVSQPAYRGGGGDAAELNCWHTSLRPANEEIAESRAKVVGRARDLVRNDGIFSGAVTNDLESIVGQGLRFIPRPDYRALGLDEDWAKEFGDGIKRLLKLWGDDPDCRCDLREVQPFAEMQRTVRRHLMVDGEALMVARWVDEPLAPLNTRLQIVNPDRLDNPPHRIADLTIHDGVEVDGAGRPVGYHIRNAHPGSREGWRGEAMRFTRVAARVPGLPMRRQVIHAFHADSADQNRGVSKFAAIIARAKAMTDYTDAELRTAIVNASFAAYVESEAGAGALRAVAGLGDDGSEAGEELVQISAARAKHMNEIDLRLNGSQVVALYPGDKFNTFTGAREAESFEIFSRVGGHVLATGLGQSYEELFRDHNQSYAASRAAMLQAWRTFRYETQFLGRAVLIPVIDLIVQEAIDRRILALPAGAPAYETHKALYLAGQVLGPARGWVDPVKDAQAADLRVAGGTSTHQAEANEQGHTIEDVLDAEVEYRRMRVDRGLPERGVVDQSVPAAETSDREEANAA